MTTPRKAGKQPKPVWVVRGTQKDQAPVLKDAGGRAYKPPGGDWQWSFWEDPTERLAAAFQGLPAPSQSPTGAEAPAAPAAPAGAQADPDPGPNLPPGVEVPAVWRKVLAVDPEQLPVSSRGHCKGDLADGQVAGPGHRGREW